MKIDAIKNGIVIDHIECGKGMEVYNFLNLDQLDCPVALIKNAYSKKTGNKDIIKIDEAIDLNLDVLGYIAPTATVNIIKDSQIVEKKQLALPQILKNVIKCKNPRCITSVEQEIEHQFRLVDEEKRIYRCVYCESKANDAM
jgi:aspartate carbamoyltransferase regulatory subunit